MTNITHSGHLRQTIDRAPTMQVDLAAQKRPRLCCAQSA